MLLAGGSVTLALWVWWLRFGREVAEELGQASLAYRGRRTRERIEALPAGTVGFWTWLPFVLFLPMFGGALVLGGVLALIR